MEFIPFKAGWKSIDFVLADDLDGDPDPRHRFEYLEVDATRIWGPRRYGLALLASLFQSIERSGQVGPEGMKVERFADRWARLNPCEFNFDPELRAEFLLE